jgi:hypothetical protein
MSCESDGGSALLGSHKDEQEDQEPLLLLSQSAIFLESETQASLILHKSRFQNPLADNEQLGHTQVST